TADRPNRTIPPVERDHTGTASFAAGLPGSAGAGNDASTPLERQTSCFSITGGPDSSAYFSAPDFLRPIGGPSNRHPLKSFFNRLSLAKPRTSFRMLVRRAAAVAAGFRASGNSFRSTPNAVASQRSFSATCFRVDFFSINENHEVKRGRWSRDQ